MSRAKFNDLGLATRAGTVHLYNVSPDFEEFLFESDEGISVGTGVPAYSYIDVPLPAKSGFAVCRDDKEWKYMEDHRGIEAYSIQTGEPIEITALGSLPSNVTTLSPITPFDTWNGDRWVTDETAKRQSEIETAAQQKRSLEQKANVAIDTLSDAIELGLAESGDEEMLKACMSLSR